MTPGSGPAGEPDRRPACSAASAVCTQAWRAPDGAVTSEQRVRVTAPVVESNANGARSLASAYWGEVERTMYGLVHMCEEDGRLELRLGPRGPVLLRFGAAELLVEPPVVACRYAIEGGLLARRAGGALTLEQVSLDDIELRSSVTGFYPNLAAPPGLPPWTGGLYTRAQARLHDAIGRRFLARLADGAA